MERAVIKKYGTNRDVVVRIDGCYFPDGTSAIQSVNAHESKWCCTGLQHSNEQVQFDFKKNRFITGSMLDMGMGGLGNILVGVKPLDKCPYCGQSLKKIGTVVMAHKSINDRYEYLQSLSDG